MSFGTSDARAIQNAQLRDREVAVRTSLETPERKLIWHGMFLFLLGLLVGFFELRFTNIRMGLSAHLEGVMNGTFLIALGAVWARVGLTRPIKGVAYGIVLLGAYGNWLATTLAAIFGTAANTPIAAGGHHGKRWQESLIAAAFLSIAIAMVVSSLLVLWGLSGRAATKNDALKESTARVSRGA